MLPSAVLMVMESGFGFDKLFSNNLVFKFFLGTGGLPLAVDAFAMLTGLFAVVQGISLEDLLAVILVGAFEAGHLGASSLEVARGMLLP